ncbi:hypothetical protein C7C56_020680 [Massilia glaciei]|uniref:Uncharacterized protein n=1 Tax=Massilia glaciei TaxID=1524097 RepID=A0A2U2HG21_9BURK|nr:hypothetical protein C7C56_020680 [Massilia glaciei]
MKFNIFLYRINRQQNALAKTLTLIPVSIDKAPPSRGDMLLRSPQGWSLSMSADVSAAWLGQLLGALS